MSLPSRSSRRSFLTVLTAFGAAVALPLVPARLNAALGNGARRSLSKLGKTIQVWKNPGCKCCEGWATNVRAAGFEVIMTEDPTLDERRKRMGVLEGLEGCHTGLLGEYVIEGHIPGDIIARFHTEAPANALGISVAGMPAGSPGMESATPVASYDVIAWHKDGSRRTFATVVPTATATTTAPAQPDAHKH